ncbi:uncharacterized protein [Pyxicephalus adspersus]|uniref:uncharacterized protein n=1 Tax=Pyxicephalus adspersus TaxID=30357 RepID=UPI003B5A552B
MFRVLLHFIFYCFSQIMAYDAFNNPDFLREFIEAYRSHPCLWKVKSADYSNRHMKLKAYDAMVELSKTVHPDADIKYVKQKIQNLRTVFKKEMNKIKSSQRSGAAADDIYVPKLWYFNLLSFTADQDEGRPSVCSLGEADKDAGEGTNRDAEESLDETSDLFKTPDLTSSCIEPAESSPAATTSTPMSSSQKRGKKRKNQELEKKEAYKKAMSVLHEKEDHLDGFGFYIVSKLRQMSPEQAGAVEFIMTDLVNKGMRKQLNPQFPT